MSIMDDVMKGGSDAIEKIKSHINSGVDLNIKNKYDETPLMIATYNAGKYTVEMIKTLTDAGANVDIQQMNKWTALMLAAYNGGNYALSMIEALMDAGADINKRNAMGWTALMIVAEDGSSQSIDIIKKLVNNGADVNTRNNNGMNALMLAAWHGGDNSERIVRLLISLGAIYYRAPVLETSIPPTIMAYIEGTKNWTSLHRAADARDAEAIRKCLIQGTTHPETVVDSTHPDMCTAIGIAGSESYPTAQSVCDDCLALLKPSLVKSVARGGGGGGGGSGGGSGGGGGCRY